jgi:molybdate transport system ATP-binding protein
MTLEVALRHRFGAFVLDVCFAAPNPGVTVLFGPSGAGKSSVIAAVAGLLRAEECRVAVGREVLADTGKGIWLAPERRRIGMVFQDARLFPHMTVAANLRFGWRRAAKRQIGFDEVVDLLGVGHLLERRPHTLSGGERQRVAIGRALLRQPQLLLMDEPLASLDAARKAEILPYIARLKAALRLPVLYVTHAPEELLVLADSAVLMEAGRVVAAGPVGEVAARADLPLARRADAAAVLACRVEGHEAARQLTRLSCGPATLWVAEAAVAAGRVVRVRIPAREVILAVGDAGALSVHNVLPGLVRAIVAEPEWHAVLVEVDIGGGCLLARVTPDAVARLGLTAGAPVSALVKSMSLELLAG